MATLERAGLRLSYEEAGSGDPAIVFVHGWTCNRTYFLPQLDHFRKNHRVLGVDLRGHGSSDAPEGEYSMSCLADDVVWICEELGISGAVGVGHSMGAVVVLEMAARHPGLLSSLVLVDAAPIAPSAEVAVLLSGLADALAGPDAQSVRRSFSEMLFLPTDDPEFKARVMDEMLTVPGHVATGCFRSLASWESEAALKALQVPVLAIHADQPINDPDRLTALCPTLTNTRTPGVGHFNQLLAPSEVNKLIEEFIG
jgi:pimeloyl-ACP methyl ester carboxylesterase